MVLVPVCLLGGIYIVSADTQGNATRAARSGIVFFLSLAVAAAGIMSISGQCTFSEAITLNAHCGFVPVSILVMSIIVVGLLLSGSVYIIAVLNGKGRQGGREP